MAVKTTQTLVCDTCGKTKFESEGKIWNKGGLAEQSKKAGWKWLDSDRKQVCPKCSTSAAKATTKSVKPVKAAKPVKKSVKKIGASLKKAASKILMPSDPE